MVPKRVGRHLPGAQGCRLPPHSEGTRPCQEEFEKKLTPRHTRMKLQKILEAAVENRPPSKAQHSARGDGLTQREQETGCGDPRVLRGSDGQPRALSPPDLPTKNKGDMKAL